MAGQADIFIADSSNHKKGLGAILDQFDFSICAGATVALKANFNSDDDFPASTHPETVRGIADAILSQGPKHLTLAERSGMGNTQVVLENRGIFELAKELGFSVSVLEEMDRSGWQEIQAAGLHWQRGFFIAKLFTQSDRVIQTCCLKTHRFGGHFTMSLKNSVGLIARRVPGLNFDFMSELHSSVHQRSMVAEINKFYNTDLVIMDATAAFSTGGPEKGKLIQPHAILAGSDRVAIDACGVALLRSYGTSHDVSEGSIFSLDQIARAAQLGIGVSSPNEIQIKALDEPSKLIANKIENELIKE